MRKSYTSIVLTLAAASLWAQVPNSQTHTAGITPHLERNAATAPVLSAVKGNGTAAAMKALRASADSDLPTADDIVSTQPEGTLYKNMYHSANVFVAYESTTTNRNYDGYVGDVVISDDNKKVYVKDPFLKFTPGTWIVGDMNEQGIVRFKFPQAVYKDDSILGYAYKMVIADGNIGPDQTTQYVRFKWENNKLSQVNPDELIGLTNQNGEWLGYGASQSEYSVMTDAAYAPTDLSLARSYKMMYADMQGSVNTCTADVCVEGDDMYIGNFYQQDFWIKGKISDGKVSFPSLQYLGIKGSSHAYMLSLDPQSFSVNQSLDFTYDASNEILSSAQAMEINVGKNTLSALDMYITPYLARVEYASETPAKPVLYGCMPWGTDPNEPEIAAVAYCLSDVSVNGNQLNQDKIFYNIYLDDELQTFDKSTYSYIKQNSMTDVPYGYVDSYVNGWTGEKGWDFMSSDGVQTVYIYKPFSKVGVKAVYVDGDTRLESEMTVYDTTDGIGDAISENGAEHSTAYYDLSGRKIAEPANGIYLKTVTYANGVSKTVKVAR